MERTQNRHLFTADALGISVDDIRDYLNSWEDPDSLVSQTAQGIISIAILKHLGSELTGKNSIEWHIDIPTLMVVVDLAFVRG